MDGWAIAFAAALIALAWVIGCGIRDALRDLSEMEDPTFARTDDDVDFAAWVAEEAD